MSDELIEVLDPKGQPSGIYGSALSPENEMMDLLNPFGQPEGPIMKMSMAERLPTLNGKTVYLIDTGFVGARQFMEEVQSWFARNHTEIKTILRSKAGNTFANDPGLWQEVKDQADASIFGVGS